MAASTHESASTSSTTSKQTWQGLRRNYIFDALDTNGEQFGVDVVEAATSITQSSRKSTIGKEEQQYIKQTIRYHYHANEITFLLNLWKVLLKDTRQARATDSLTDEEWLTQSWMKDGLRSVWQAHFNSKAVPQLDPEDPWVKYTAPPKVKTPYPVITYGYDIESCNMVTQEYAERFGTSPCKGLLLFPWFIVEAKSSAESIDDADAQCARGGATIVSQDRKFSGIEPPHCLLNAVLQRHPRTTSHASAYSVLCM